MAQPTPYDRITNFQDQQATAPTAPYPAPDFDAEYNAIKITTDEIINNLGLIQRDDGQLKNGIVTSDSLSPELALGFDAPAPWESGVQYIKDMSTVFEGTGFYVCTETHISTIFATDLAEGRWALLADFSDVAGDAAASADEAAASAAAAAAAATAAADSALEAANAVGVVELAVEAVAFRWAYSSNGAMADPGVGGVRFNNAALAAVTQIAISGQSGDSGNPNVHSFVLTWDDSTTVNHRGVLIVRKASAPENYAVFAINGALTNNMTWAQIPVAYVGSNGAFADADELVTHFTRTGNQGAAGAGSGDMVSANNLSDVQSVPASRTNLGLGTGNAPQFNGATMTGPIVLPGAPTLPLHAATRKYIDDAAITWEQFNCVGDGVVDDTNNMLLAIAAANAKAPCTIFARPGASYKTSAALNFLTAGVVADFRGASIKPTGVADYAALFFGGGAVVTSVTLTAPGLAGTNQITVNSAAQLAVNDALVLVNASPVRTQRVRITAIAGNVVTFTPNLVEGYNTGSSAAKYATVTATAAKGTNTMTLSSVTNLVVDGYIYIRELTTTTPAHAWDLIARVVSIAGLVVTLDTILPFALTSGNPQTIYKVNLLERCGVRNAVIDLRSAGGTAMKGLYVAFNANGVFDNIEVLGGNNGMGITTVTGRDNTYTNLRTYRAGGGINQDQDIQFTSETSAHIRNFRSRESKGFGPTIVLNSYSDIADAECYDTTHRGFKLQQCASCNVNGVKVIGAGTTGFGLVVGCIDNNISNVISRRAGRLESPGTQYGIWIDDSSNNNFSNMLSEGSTLWDLIEEDGTGNVYTNIRVSDVNKVSLSPAGNGIIVNLVGANATTPANHGKQVGGFLSAALAAPGVALTSTTAASILTMDLPPGDWDVTGMVNTGPAAGTTQSAFLAAFNTSAALPGVGDSSYARFSVNFTVGAPQFLPLGTKRFTLAATTTIHMVAQINFSGGTCNAYGSMYARRAR